MNRNKGRLFIISAPSGTGKSTVIGEILKRREDIFFSVSATTRTPRQGEVDGVDYWFLTRQQFDDMVEKDEFLEHAEYVGNCYGTPIKPILENIARGCDIILDIEVQGFEQIKKKMPEAISVFIIPPSLDALRARLVGRGTDSEETIERRIAQAKKELKLIDRYDYVVTNDIVENAVNEIISIMDR